ncbi:hypothetical protein E2562_033475 [Oryza meyeriana var. granulata]|uniref:Uncharacterized protein n=1 Tax=Oryza meyeriana var. granulata TaxID=110450 RepID=A0A6G1F0Y9_9ORYZ|nr:hypothetical protein E2562_033475 [Oryza meyeriana var. granulata]
MPLSIQESLVDIAPSSSLPSASAHPVGTESSPLAAGPSPSNTADECTVDKRPAADSAPLSACQKLCQGASSPPRASSPFGGSLATTFYSTPSPPTTIAVTVGGVLSVSLATPCLATVTTESTMVTTVVVAPRDGREVEGRF